MKPLHLILAPVAIGCGALLALLTRQPDSPSAGTSSQGLPVRSHAAGTVAASADLKPGELAVHTLAALEDYIVEDHSRLSKEELTALRHLPDAELQALLAQLGQGWLGQGNRDYFIMQAGIREMLDRDPGKVKVWMTGLGKEHLNFCYQIIIEMGSRDPVAAATWFQDLTGQGAEQARGIAFTLAALGPLKGAQAMLAMERILDGIPGADMAKPFGSGNFFHTHGYEENFDFQTYVTESHFTDGVREAMSYWAFRSPEAAWSGIKGQLQERPGLFSDMTIGIAAAQGEEAAAKWAAARLDEMPADSRQSLIAALGDYRSLTNGSSDKTREAPDSYLIGIMKALPSDEDRLYFAENSFEPQPINPSAGIAALKELPTPELKYQALKANAERIAARGDSEYPGADRTSFLIAMANLGLLTDDHQQEINRILKHEQ